MTDFIKLEMHAHTKGGSSCAQADENALARIYAEAGYGGVVLTNHCCEASFSLYPGNIRIQMFGIPSVFEKTSRPLP